MMQKNTEYLGIAKIEKIVAEYNVWDQHIKPHGKFKIKISQDIDSSFYWGHSNIQIMDGNGSMEAAIGHGKTEEEALENTIMMFLELIGRKNEWEEKDFEYSDSFDF